MGYVPSSTDLVKRLERLRGEFRPSSGELLAPYGLIIAIAIFGSAMFAFAAFDKFREGFDIGGAWLGVVFAIVFLLMGALLAYYMGQSYVFDNGTISCVWLNGKVIWRESLAGLQHVACRSTRGGVWLILKWPDRSRHIRLLDAIDKALARGL